MKHEEYIQTSKDCLWLPFTQMKDYDADPLVIAEGKGVKLYDTEGKEYYDAFSSVWLNVHGHQKKELNEAIVEQLDKIAHSTLLGMTNVPATKLAKKLVEITPEGLTRVFYSDSGATSVEIGLKMAYQYWLNLGEKRTTFITMKNGYHGDTIGAVSVGDVDVFHQIYQPLMFESHVVPYPYVYRHPSGNEEACVQDCLNQLEEKLKQYHEDVCAVICEPMMQGAGGMINMPFGYLKKVRELCDTYNVLLICDEVATGFGRTGKLFAVEYDGVTPDIMTAGKCLTGGYLPVAITLTKEKIYEAFYDDFDKMKTFFHGHSYTGNPLGCAVALKNLELFEQDNIVGQVAEKSVYLAELLKDVNALDHVGDIRQLGFMTGIELVRDKETKEPFDASQRVGYKATLRMRELGLLTRPLGDVIVFMPPHVTTKEELQEMVAIVRQAIDEVTKEAHKEAVSVK